MKKKKMKKWIPDYIYCSGVYGKRCPWYKTIWYNVTPEMEEHIKNCKINYPERLDIYLQAEKEYAKLKEHPYKHKREECQFSKGCKNDCSKCKETVSKCEYLGCIEYGQYPLGDWCKICGVRYDKYKYHIKELKDYYDYIKRKN